jgi:hypothetical protein
MWKVVVSLVTLTAACGGGGVSPLPPLAPMPPGPGWIGEWDTGIGPLELRRSAEHDVKAEHIAEFPIAGNLWRGPTDLRLRCRRPHENHLWCGWDEDDVTADRFIDSGVMVLVMDANGVSFVANLSGRERTERVTGRRIR